MIRLPAVNCQYGAPMGRESYNSERHLESEETVRLHLQRVAMVDGGAYDSGGAYWGIGAPLWCAWLRHLRIDTRADPEGNIRIFVRAKTREKAKLALLEELDDELGEFTKFYR